MEMVRRFTMLALPMLIAAAPASQRWKPDAASIAAFRAGDMAKARAALEVERARCEAEARGGDSCLDLLTALAEVARQAGDDVLAERWARRALAVAEAHLTEAHPDRSMILLSLGNAISGQGRWADSEPFYRRAVGLREAALPPGDPMIA
ncbi:tetratricopeptide repeat protein [Sphingomonas sp.]|uniref:tetratricopeptide repeat protein n=1 Tax=Sphingomonas sp. TaxID=28214 RepID=UPI00307E6591